MMKKSKRMMFVTALIATMLATGYGASQIYATDTQTQNTLVQMIAQKFGLKETEVETVFNQHRALRQQEMQVLFEQRLTAAVQAGKLTESQKSLIVAKHKEIMANRQSEMEQFRSLSVEERRVAREKRHAELEAWAKQNNIDLQYFMQGMGGEGMRGGGRGMRKAL